MVKYSTASEGNKFVLTEYGLEQSRIRAKYQENNKNKKRYETSAPTVWIEKGYIKEVKR